MTLLSHPHLMSMAKDLFSRLLVRVDTARERQLAEHKALAEQGRHPSLLVNWTVECEDEVARFVQAVVTALQEGEGLSFDIPEKRQLIEMYDLLDYDPEKRTAPGMQPVWVAAYDQALDRQHRAIVAALREQLRAFCEVAGEETPEDALMVLRVWEAEYQKACAAIKSSEGLDANTYPSMNERIWWRALRTENARLTARVQELERCPMTPREIRNRKEGAP